MIIKYPPPCPIKKKINIQNQKLKKKNNSKLQSSDYLFPRFLVLFLLSFYFILLSSATAQVKIKEKVEIKPKLNVNIGKGAKNSTASSDYYPCGPWKPSNDLYNPWQVVWYGSSYHLDPGQQAFSYQANLYDFRRLIDSTKTYDFIVTQGKELCHIE